MRNDSAAPLVSVCMVVYNHAPFLKDAIEGVLAQRTAFPIELVIGEDCSTDDSLSIVRAYEQAHPGVIRVLSGPENLGMIRNFHRTLMVCRGEYIALCEGDDWWCNPDKLSLQIACFQANPDASLVHANLLTADPRGSGWQVSAEPVHKPGSGADLSGDMFGSLLRHLTVKTCTSVYRREFISEFLSSRFSNTAYTCIDVPLAVCAAARGPVGYVDEIVGVYRRSPNSATRSGFTSMVRLMAGVAGVFQDFEAEFGSRPDFDPRAVEWVYDCLCRAAFRAGDARTFTHSYRKISQPSRGLRVRHAMTVFPAAMQIANAALDLRAR